MRAEMKKANYASVRGPYKYGNNHFPIQNFYLQEPVKTADNSYALRTVATALAEHQDRYHDRCPMK
jgi:branched-chain amino acid transport system substrate-binding protein